GILCEELLENVPQLLIAAGAHAFQALGDSLLELLHALAQLALLGQGLVSLALQFLGDLVAIAVLTGQLGSDALYFLGGGCEFLRQGCQIVVLCFCSHGDYLRLSLRVASAMLAACFALASPDSLRSNFDRPWLA